MDRAIWVNLYVIRWYLPTAIALLQRNQQLFVGIEKNTGKSQTQHPESILHINHFINWYWSASMMEANQINRYRHTVFILTKHKRILVKRGPDKSIFSDWFLFFLLRKGTISFSRISKNRYSVFFDAIKFTALMRIHFIDDDRSKGGNNRIELVDQVNTARSLAIGKSIGFILKLNSLFWVDLTTKWKNSIHFRNFPE